MIFAGQERAEWVVAVLRRLAAIGTSLLERQEATRCTQNLLLSPEPLTQKIDEVMLGQVK